jgi:hypothetical protein
MASKLLKSYEVRRLFETAIDEATGDTVTLDRAAALKLRDYIRANQCAADQLRYMQENLEEHLTRSFEAGRRRGTLSSETLAWFQKTDFLVHPNVRQLPAAEQLWKEAVEALNTLEGLDAGDTARRNATCDLREIIRNLLRLLPRRRRPNKLES